MDYNRLEIIARNVVYLRKRKKLSQDELANIADIDRSYLGYIENAKYNITVQKVDTLAKALDVTIFDLLNTELINKYENSKNSEVLAMNLLLPGIILSEYPRQWASG